MFGNVSAELITEWIEVMKNIREDILVTYYLRIIYDCEFVFSRA